MFDRIQGLLSECGIELSAPIALRDCTVNRPYLLKRVGIDENGTAVIFAIPYHTPFCEASDRNCSRYAVSRDYHLFIKELADTLLPILHEEYPLVRFALFADHSPIDERDAAARAGLGIIGKNRLLITEKYSSYVFLGELITSAPAPSTSILPAPPSCEGCNACLSACPLASGRITECLSALTQKKGTLSLEEREQIAAYGSIWGCDICQEVCPHTQKALAAGTLTSPIPFFHKEPLPRLTYRRIQDMTDEQFSGRAYAWRGRDVILRNLSVTEQLYERSNGAEERE